jgi:glycosyltransferase involved in cell wall biosynthesis
MRVCLIAYKFYESSPALLQFATALATRGDDVDVVSLRREDQPEFEQRNGVNVYRLQRRVTDEKDRSTYLLRIFKFFLRSTFLLSVRHLFRRYQLIHVQSVPDFLVFSAVLARLLRVPVILDAQDLVPEFYASKFNGNRRSIAFQLLAMLERASMAFSSHVIVPTHLWQQRLLTRSVEPSKCTVIRYFPDPSMVFPRPKHHSDRFLIVYPGTLNSHQGVDVAIKAFARVLAEIPQAEFHIYGEGPDKPYLAELACGLGVADRVKFSDMLSKEKIVQVMAQSDVAVEPKLLESPFANETCSVKLLDFMALGIPVVASRTRIHAFYCDDTMVKFYEVDHEKDLADAILLLSRDAPLRQQFVTNGLKYIQTHDWATERKRYYELVDRLRGIRDFPANVVAP